MKAGDISPIPTPWPQRWRTWRLSYLPLAMLALCVGIIAWQWRDYVCAPQFTGQAEPVLANLASHRPGTLADVAVVRFQKVRTGDVLGRVLIADPAAAAASLEVVRLGLANLQASLAPLVQQQRNAVNYLQVRLEWMRQRADLAAARVNLQLAELNFQRTDELLAKKLVPQSEWDTARATRDSLQQQVAEMSALVAEAAVNFTNIQPAGADQLVNLSNEPMRAALAEQEAKLKFAEAELAPVLLRAPMDGMITAIHHRSGESVVAGEPVMDLAAETPARIVGYLRAPNLQAAKTGMKVQVRLRSPHRESALAQVTALGSQLETPPLPLALAVNPAADLALPVEITVPSQLAIHPGEVVDLALLPE